MASSRPTEQKVWILNERPTDKITADTFKLETRPVPPESELKDGEALVKVTHFGNDPAQRTWMDDSIPAHRLYIAPINKGDIVRSFIIGTVVASKSKQWESGTEVYGYGGWAEYVVLSDSARGGKLVKLPGQSPYISASILGSIGLTAYFGAFDEMKLKPEHTLVVSGAAGAVGSTLVQIAKNVIGCKRVVGIAGGKEKCAWVKSLGADDCIDYKDPNYPKLLADALPEYADFYFDNVGGEILNNMLRLIKRYGYVCACGAISAYNDKSNNLTNWGEVIYNRLNIKGMIIFDHFDKAGEAVSDLTKWLKEGKIVNTEGETVVEAKFEDVPKVWDHLFTGGNRGKLITKLI